MMGKSQETVTLEFLQYVNKLVQLIRPKKELFLALDGPAPRAKQQQQRSRRFLAERGSLQSLNTVKHITDEEWERTLVTDQINPGTEFMVNITRSVRYFIARKMQEDPYWRSLTVIFSGADVPGEGEHKMFAHIREKVAKSDSFNWNDSYCVYSVDADIVMLSLSTKIRYITILRDSKDWTKTIVAAQREELTSKFQLVYINLLWDYFNVEFKEIMNLQLKFDFNIYRIIDDLILIFLFVGNDFIPKAYCFDIRTGQLNELIKCFKTYLATATGYMNNKGIIDFTQLDLFLREIKKIEFSFMQAKAQHMLNEIQRNREENHRDKANDDALVDGFDSIFNEKPQEDQEGQEITEMINENIPSEMINSMIEKEIRLVSDLGAGFGQDYARARD